MLNAAKSYKKAHAFHYEEKKLQEALAGYMEIIVAYPESPEAGYSRSQIQNIATAVVPANELLNAQTSLVNLHLDKSAPNKSQASLS